MANFQKMTLIIACIILLICIVIILMVFLFPNTKQVWPPLVSNCPDYFIDEKGDGSQCRNTLKLGRGDTCNGVNGLYNFNISPYIGSGGNCAKYNWANDCGLTWDGITYGVKNPCTNLNK